jgi:hypothetical protein
MPTKIDRKLKKGAHKKGLKPGTDRYNKYVYGTGSRIQANMARKRKAGRKK